MSEITHDPELERRLNEAKIAQLEEETRKLRMENNEREKRPDYATTYHFYAPVTDSSVARCMYELEGWSRRFPGCTITIFLNSPGGSVIDGFALYDYLQELKRRGHKIVVKGYGMCASMGGILLQAGDERIMSARGLLLIHEVSGGVIGTASQMEDKVKFVSKLQDMALDILAERANIKRNTIKRNWKRRDWWLDADEALKKGFIDRIED